LTRLLIALAVLGLLVLISWLVSSRLFGSEVSGARFGRGGMLVSGATLLVVSALAATGSISSPIGTSPIYFIVIPPIIGLVLVWGSFRKFFRVLAWIAAPLILIWAYVHLGFDVGAACLLPGVLLVGAAIAASVPERGRSGVV
jgi:hypothetical protein